MMPHITETDFKGWTTIPDHEASVEWELMRLPVIWPTSKNRGVFLSVWCLIPPVLALLFVIVSALVSALRALASRKGNEEQGRETHMIF
jgi:hypothetical protein